MCAWGVFAFPFFCDPWRCDVANKLDPTDRTVFLPSVRVTAKTEAELRETAQRRGLKMSDVTRQALAWYLSASNPQPSDKVTT